MTLFQMGLLTGQRSLSASSGYVFTGGDGGALPFGQALTGPFSGAPFTGAQVNGLAIETMLVRRHVRVGWGVAKPFASFRLSDATSIDPEAGAVGVRAISLWDLRFALGGEFTVGRVTPALDVVGTAEHVGADLSVQGQAVSYSAWAFGLSARAGVRVAIDEHLYLVASGQVGLQGGWPWMAELAVGCAAF